MAGRPLRPATRHRLGEPLPHQQTDRPRAHPPPKNFPPQPMRAIVISSISPDFSELSQSGGQVTHVLLTRSPLIHPVQAPSFIVRLACVKHAASVRPEPGSNSPQKNFRTTSETGREKPETQQKNKPPQTTQKVQPMLASKKLLQRKNKFPQPDGVKNKETKKLNTITCQPIHLNAAETPNSIQISTCSTYPTGTHQPTNH